MKFTAGMRAALVVTSVAVVAIAARPSAMINGWSFSWKVSVDADQKQGAQPLPSMNVKVVPGKLRMDFVGTGPGQPKGGYMIMDAEKGTMAMVSPEEKTATTMKPEAMGAAFGAVGSFVKMDFQNITYNVVDKGAGPSMLGYATHHYEISQSYDTDVSVFGKKVHTKTATVTNAFMANEFISDRAFAAWSERFTRSASALGGDGMKKLMDAEKNRPAGFPLKQVSVTTTTDDKGKATTSTTTMEMTEFSKTNLDAAVFEIPKDYQVVDMDAQIAEMKQAMEQAKEDCEEEHGKGSAACDPASINLDSLVAATRLGVMEGMKEGLREGAKESVKDAVKGGIMGRFKKKKPGN